MKSNLQNLLTNLREEDDNVKSAIWLDGVVCVGLTFWGEKDVAELALLVALQVELAIIPKYITSIFITQLPRGSNIGTNLRWSYKLTPTKQSYHLTTTYWWSMMTSTSLHHQHWPLHHLFVCWVQIPVILHGQPRYKDRRWSISVTSTAANGTVTGAQFQPGLKNFPGGIF